MTEKLTPADIIPQRPPFLFIDSITHYDETGKLTAERSFHADEPFFAGHFPGNPIVPGVILIECMAQAMAYLAMRRSSLKNVYLSKIHEARFRKPVLPGHTVILSVELLAESHGLVEAQVKAHVSDALVASAKLQGFSEKK